MIDVMVPNDDDTLTDAVNLPNTLTCVVESKPSVVLPDTNRCADEVMVDPMGLILSSPDESTVKVVYFVGLYANLNCVAVDWTSRAVPGNCTPIPTLLFELSNTKVFESKFSPFVTEAVAALYTILSVLESPNVKVSAET